MASEASPLAFRFALGVVSTCGFDRCFRLEDRLEKAAFLAVSKGIVDIKMFRKVSRIALQSLTWIVVGVSECKGQTDLDGFWQSDGFGYVFSITGSNLQAFEVTAATCVASFSASKVRGSHLGGDAEFRSEDDLYRVRRGSVDGTWLVRQQEAIADIKIHRIQRLPAVCEPTTQDTPEGNFNVFVQTWAENYISFERRGVDWAQIVAQYRPSVSSTTTPQELFSVLRAMVERFDDMHTFVSAPNLKETTPRYWRPGTDRVVAGGIEEFANRGRGALFSKIDRINLHGKAKKVCNGGLHYGELGGGVGYLRIRSFGNYAESNDAKALERCLDKIFAGWKIQSLVVDMRLAFGGSDELGLAIAARFASEAYVAFEIKARAQKLGGWTSKQPVLVQPVGRPGFYGPIAILTGPVTFSAAESFVLAISARKAATTRIGESTQGVFCDVLVRRLPNGWSFGLPNAVYSTTNGNSFDVTGIPPNISVAVFREADLQRGKEPAVETALQVLAKTRNEGQ